VVVGGELRYCVAERLRIVKAALKIRKTDLLDVHIASGRGLSRTVSYYRDRVRMHCFNGIGMTVHVHRIVFEPITIVRFIESEVRLASGDSLSRNWAKVITHSELARQHWRGGQVWNLVLSVQSRREHGG
jgi:hypothetical protein